MCARHFSPSALGFESCLGVVVERTLRFLECCNQGRISERVDGLSDLQQHHDLSGAIEVLLKLVLAADLRPNPLKGDPNGLNATSLYIACRFLQVPPALD